MKKNRKFLQTMNIESFAEAKKRNCYKIKLFFNSNNPTLIKLGKKLKNCRKGHRCNSLACAVCLRRFRIKFLETNLPKLKQLCNDYDLYMATVICNVPVNMATDNINTFKEWFYKRLQESNLDSLKLVGGIDYSFNQVHGNSYSPYWCQHCHFVVATNHKEYVREVLSGIFIRDGVRLKKTPELALLENFEDIDSVTNYSVPSFFETRYKRLNGRTAHWPLNSKLEKEIALFLASNNPRDLQIEQNLTTRGGVQCHK